MKLLNCLLFTFGIVFQTATASISSGPSITFPNTAEEEPEKHLQYEQYMQLNVTNHTELPSNVIEREIVAHISNIGLKTLRELLTVHDNVIISPFNIFSCLGMLSLGASGNTHDELRSILGPKSENVTISHLVQNRRGVSIASGLFLDSNFVPKKSFVDSASSEYLASVMNFNFSQREETVNYINRWVSDNTNGTITNLLSGNLDSNTKMVVVSALLFDGKWLQSFSPEGTIPGTFDVGNGETVDIKLMHLSATVLVVKNPLLDAIGLPYQEEGMMIYFILPKTPGPEALKKLLSHLNVNSLKKLKKESAPEEIIIILPKIKITRGFSLSESLKKQGISSVFNPSQANFSDIAADGSGLFVSDIYHNVHFEIKEEGTLASAATAAILTKNRKFVFKANRPFIFVITNENSVILFMGAILHP